MKFSIQEVVSKMKYHNREVYIDDWVCADQLYQQTNGMFIRPSWCKLYTLQAGNHIKVGNCNYVYLLKVCEHVGWRQSILCEVVKPIVQIKPGPYQTGDILLIEMKHVLHVVENPKVIRCGVFPNLRSWLEQSNLLS